MAFFDQSDSTTKKPSFFQRIRQAVTGTPASEEIAGTPSETPPAPPPATSVITTESTRPDHVETAPASVPAAVTSESQNDDDLAPLSLAELAAFEGLETPAFPEREVAIAVELALPSESFPDAIPAAPRDARTTLNPAATKAFTPPAPPDSERNEFGLRPMNTNFSFGGYASAEEEDNYFVETMRSAVARTRDQFTASLDSVLALGRRVDEDTLEELEAVLLTADIGLTTTQEIIGILRNRALRENSSTADLKTMLGEELRGILNAVDQPTNHPTTGPEVLMMVGVNGTGKTTTSGKLAALYGTHGRRALLCAADTFRAAAIEQLEVWARRSGVDIIKTKQGGDPSAALYDALTAGKARKADIVIVDTAGRLHNKKDLMNELDKMRRTAEKLVPGAPHQTFLVMDATTGQNGLQQARLFLDAARVTGIVLTKLDGTAKGGIVIAIAHELRLPVVFVGTGEKMEDIVPFDTDTFIDSLLSA